jgi:transposase
MEKFSDADRKRLLASPYVEKLTESHVVFTSKFKSLAIKKYLEGMSPSDIFNDLGIDTSLFLPDFPKKSIARWKTIFFEEGVEGFEKENRGRGSKGRSKRPEFKSLEEEVAYLREENEFLKKLMALAEEYQKKNGSY